MARHIEERIDELERLMGLQSQQQHATVGLDARLVRLEEIIEHVFGFVGRIIHREEITIKARAAEIAAQKKFIKTKRSLKKSKPVKRRTRTRS